MNATWIVYFKELRESLRDRRVLLNTFVIGPLLGPVLFIVLINFITSRELDKAGKPLPVAVIGAERAPNLVEALKQSGIELRPAPADPEAAVREQRVDLVLRIPEKFAEDWSAGRVAQVELLFDSSRREGGASVERLRNVVHNYAARIGAMRLVMRGLSPAVAQPLVIAERDQATAQARGALLFGMLPYMLVFATFFGGMFLAIDATAGERERQSLEPLLINPVPRARILLGKVLATASFSICSVLISLTAFSVAAHFLPVEKLDMTLDLGPRFVAQVLPVMLPLVFLVAVLQTLVSAYAKNFREAQTYLGILQILPLIPSMMLTLMPFKPQLWMYGVPLVGQQLVIAQLLRAEAVDIAQLGLCFAVTAAAGLLVFRVTQRLYGSERLAVST
jgi:sodium transport system permease protein